MLTVAVSAFAVVVAADDGVPESQCDPWLSAVLAPSPVGCSQVSGGTAWGTHTWGNHYNVGTSEHDTCYQYIAFELSEGLFTNSYTTVNSLESTSSSYEL